MITSAMIILPSVGSAFDPKTLLVHPLLIGGAVDTDEGSAVHIEDVVIDWIGELSPEDYSVVRPHLPDFINIR